MQSCDIVAKNPPWTTRSGTKARNSFAYARLHLHMPTVPNSEAEIPKTSRRMHKVIDVLPLCHKVAYEAQTVVEGQGCFVQNLGFKRDK